MFEGFIGQDLQDGAGLTRSWVPPLLIRFLCLFVADSSLLLCGLLFFVDVFAVRLLDAKLFQTILQRAESQAQELRGLGDVVISLLHRLRDQVALDVFEIDPFGRQLERALRCWSNILTNFGW